MTSLDDIQDLAAALHSRRDTWELVPTLNYLIPHRGVPIEQLWPAAVAWAENPKNRTPASLQYLKIEPNQSPESSSLRKGRAKNPAATSAATPAPTATSSTSSRCRTTCPTRTGSRAKTKPKPTAHPDSSPTHSPTSTPSAKPASTKPASEIRPTKAANAHSLKDRRNPPRRCAGCQGTLAQDEHERHPGCTPEGAACRAATPHRHAAKLDVAKSTAPRPTTAIHPGGFAGRLGSTARVCDKRPPSCDRSCPAWRNPKRPPHRPPSRPRLGPTPRTRPRRHPALPLGQVALVLDILANNRVPGSTHAIPQHVIRTLAAMERTNVSRETSDEPRPEGLTAT